MLALLSELLLGIARRALLPPTALFLAAGIGLFLLRRIPILGKVLLLGSGLTMLVLCLPWVASLLAASLQDEPVLRLRELPAGGQAVVILGADVQGYTPELERPDVGPMTLTRLRYGAILARASGLPIAVSGGPTVRGVPPLGELMATVLEEEHGLVPTIVEGRSLTTRENARELAPLLEQAGIERVLLVSHAWHMPRAREAFEREGIAIVPAPTGALGRPDGFLRGFVPSASSLRSSCFAIHEWVGRLWYSLTA